jgi:dihydroflavonol-4-reductase
LEKLPVERAVGDILDVDSLRRAMRGMEGVFHTAAQSAYWRRPQDVIQSAVEGTRNVVQAAKEAGVHRLVLTSSMAAMGVPKHGELLTEAHVFNLPASAFPYGYAKYQSELEALRCAGPDLEVVIVNPSVVLGRGDIHQISGSLVIEAAHGRAVIWVEGGINAVHIGDVVAGHLAAMERGEAGERYLLGGENLTHRQVFTQLAEIVGRKPPRFKVPGWAIQPAAALVDWAAKIVRLPLDANQLRLSRYYLYCDASRARRDLGLGDPIPFRRAAEEAYDWYRAQGVI